MVPIDLSAGMLVDHGWVRLLGGGSEGLPDLRWPGWQEEVAALGPDQGISVYPFLFTAQSRMDAGRSAS